MPTKMERYVEVLYEILPCDSVMEIMAKMQKRLGRGHTKITKDIVYKVLHYVREHPDECGYTVPHVKRGNQQTDERKKFFALLIQPDGTFEYDDDFRDYRDTGAVGTLRGIASSGKHLVAMLNASIDVEPSAIYKDLLEEIRDDLDSLRKRAHRLALKLA